jgi:uncharacterized tellurite resistance protein B-like protein
MKPVRLQSPSEELLAARGLSVENRAVLNEIDRATRLELMKFVCSFAWADLAVHPAERSFVARLASRLDFEPEDEAQVRQWLRIPPAPESVDPNRIPREHRRLFLAAIDGVIAADGQVSPEERDSLALLKELMA